MNIQFRGEFYNLLSHPVFAAPTLNPTSEAFGTIANETSNRATVIQAGARVIW